MLSNNVVSFMKKMVKTTETGQQQADNAAANKLSRLKQTLTSGLQQAHESVVKFSPKVIHVDVTGRRPSGIDEATTSTSLMSSSSAAGGSAKDIPDVIANPSLLGLSSGINKGCAGPPNRLTSCRVCVRSLTAGTVSYRLCSQCNLKVCEDCASYSNLDNEVDQTFWRCSVCRRRSASVATPTATPGSSVSSASGASGASRQAGTPTLAQRWSEEKPGSVLMDDHARKATSGAVPVPGSAPVSRRRGTSVAIDSSDLKKEQPFPSIQQQGSARSGNCGHSAEDVRGGGVVSNGRASTNSGSSRTDHHIHHQQHKSTSVLSSTSISASESSPDDPFAEQQRCGSGAHRRSTCGVETSSSGRGHSASVRRSFQQQPKDQSLYLSADDASLARRPPNRRYSSESSDTPDVTAGATQQQQRRSQDDEDGGRSPSSPSATSPSTTRRRMSFRSSRSRPQHSQFYDVDGSEGYDADEQSAMSAGTFGSSPPSMSTGEGMSNVMGPSSGQHLMTMTAESPSGSRMLSPRRSCSDIPSHELISAGQQNSGDRHRKVSTQISDPPPVGHSSQRNPSFSNRSGGRRSVERAAISIIIDDADATAGSAGGPLSSSHADSSSNSAVIVARLRRDPSRASSASFTSGFGLTLSSRHHGFGSAAVIARIEPHGSADRAGLRMGDVILSWDGVQLSGRSLEEVQDELKHSGDSIQIEVERPNTGTDRDAGEGKLLENSSCGPVRPNKLASNLIALDAAGGGSSGRATPPSPTRRRLPQAPVAGPQQLGTDSGGMTPNYRVQLKIKSSMTEAGRSSHHQPTSSLAIAVVSAESPNSSSTADEMTSSVDDSFGWVTLILTLPNGAGSRMFTTDRIESVYGLLRWNAIFTCPDLTLDEAARSQLSLSLWEDSFQRGEIKLAETKLDLDRVAMDGRSFWLSLRPCSSAGDIHYGSSPMPSPNVSRRPSRSVPAVVHQKQPNADVHYSSRNSSELSVDRGSNSPPSSIPSTPPGMSRSRSAELAAHLLLQPEMPGWGAASGLSAPASLAPSRRGSNFNCGGDETTLGVPQSSAPSSRRGSAVLPAIPQQAAEQLLMVQEKLSGGGSRRPSQHQLPAIPPERVLNTSSLELGAGQILPHSVMKNHRGVLGSSSSNGQIKLGLIITQGQLEVEVIAARHLPLVGESGTVPPDTFVKVSLCDQERLFSKRKTKTMRQTCHPQFHQTLFFEACNALGATLVVDVRLRDSSGIRRSGKASPSYHHQQQHQQYPSYGGDNGGSLGLVHIGLDRLALTALTISWYRLIPAHLIDLNDQFYSDDSP